MHDNDQPAGPGASTWDPGRGDDGGIDATAAGSGAASATDAADATRVAATVEVDGYDQLELVGRGGYATVWRARQISVGRQVALKVLDHATADASSQHRFESEIAALVEVSWSPSIVHIHDAGITADGRPYLALEYMPGGSVAHLVNTDGPLSPAQVVAIGCALAGALSTAHGAGVLHRDIKPDNILVDRGGNARLADFGIALVAGPATSATGGAHSFRGTVMFSAPEVLDGDTPTEATDMWGVGATLYMLCSGHAPFVQGTGQTDSLSGVIRRTLLDDPDPLPDQVPEALAAVITWCLAKDPADRPASADELRDALVHAAAADDLDVDGDGRLRAVSVEPGSIGPAGDPANGAIRSKHLGPETIDPTRRKGRTKVLIGVSTALAVLVLAGIGWAAWRTSADGNADGTGGGSGAVSNAIDEHAAPDDIDQLHTRSTRLAADRVALAALGLSAEELNARFDQPSGPDKITVVTDDPTATDTSPQLAERIDSFVANATSPVMTSNPTYIPRGINELGYGHAPVRFNHRAINKVLNERCYEVFDDDLVALGVAGGSWTNGPVGVTVMLIQLSSVAEAERFFAASTMFFGVEARSCDGWPDGGIAINETDLRPRRDDFPVAFKPDQLFTAISSHDELAPGVQAEVQYAVLARSGNIVTATQAVSFDPSVPREELRATADEAASELLS